MKLNPKGDAFIGYDQIGDLEDQRGAGLCCLRRDFPQLTQALEVTVLYVSSGWGQWGVLRSCAPRPAALLRSLSR